MAFVHAQLGDDALILAAERGLDYRDPAECAWALLCDAAATFEAMPETGPRAYPRRSPLPDPVRTRWELFGVERERITDRVQIDTPCRRTPSARQISRAEAVRELWHPQAFRGLVKAPERSVKALWLYAGGVPPRRVAKAVGIAKPTLHAHRRRMCLTIGRVILPHLEDIVKSA